MNLRRLAPLALASAAAFGSAQATTTASTLGPTTTYFENFNGATDFTTAAWFNAPGSDDYLWLSGLAPTASYNFYSAAAIASLTLSFWFSAPQAGDGHVTLATLNSDLPGTNFLLFLPNNPGSGGPVLADSQFSTTLYNLAAGNYSLSFSRNAGLGNLLKVDDVELSITAVPEPETYALMLGGLGVVGWVARRRRPDRG